MPGSQDYAQDPRNDSVLVYLNGSLVPRDAARVSVFDAVTAYGRASGYRTGRFSSCASISAGCSPERARSGFRSAWTKPG
jgi:hypothetical protein